MFKIKHCFCKMVVAALLTVIVLTSCNPSKPAPQFKLRIGILTTQNVLPYFVMQEQGFAKRHGLQFVETSYPGGGPIIEAITTGSLDVGAIGSTPILFAAERGLIPDKIVPVAANDFADPDHPGAGVLVAHSINGWKDLKGQQIAINVKGSLTDIATKVRLQQEGISGYNLVEIPIANEGLAVAGGNVAAATMVEPYLTQSLLRKDGKLLGWVIGGPPFKRIPFTMIVFSTNFYRNNPQAVKAYLRAHLQAAKWINQNLADARAILGKCQNLSGEVSQKMNLLRFSQDGRNDPALLENMQPLLVKANLLKAAIPASQLYDETLLKEVLAEKR